MPAGVISCDKSHVENKPVFFFLYRKDEEKREIAVTLKDELAKERLPPKSQRARSVRGRHSSRIEDPKLRSDAYLTC
jgi:hypothetical protein